MIKYLFDALRVFINTALLCLLTFAILLLIIPGVGIIFGVLKKLIAV